MYVLGRPAGPSDTELRCICTPPFESPGPLRRIENAPFAPPLSWPVMVTVTLPASSWVSVNCPATEAVNGAVSAELGPVFAAGADSPVSAAAMEQDPALAGPQPPPPLMIVDVADDGPGLPQDASDKVFDPFFTTKPQVSGLGLAIVRKIVDAHDGRIDVSSAPGQGTRFRVTLPVTSAGGWFK
jgi:hypothetical protein